MCIPPLPPHTYNRKTQETSQGQEKFMKQVLKKVQATELEQGPNRARIMYINKVNTLYNFNFNNCIL